VARALAAGASGRFDGSMATVAMKDAVIAEL
jgi:hypothetical protein